MGIQSADIYASAFGADGFGDSMNELPDTSNEPVAAITIADRGSVVSVQSDSPTPTYADRPIGIDATGTRTEFDNSCHQ